MEEWQAHLRHPQVLRDNAQLLNNLFHPVNLLIQMAGSGESFNNEMDLLARWSKTNPTSAFALPTLATEILGRNFIIPENIKCLKAQDIDGIVDAAQLGQWVAGIDPRNVPISEHPTSKFVDQDAPSHLNRNLLEELKFVLLS